MPYNQQDQTEQDLFNEIIEQFQLSKRYLDPIHEKMNKQEELYRTYLDPNNYPHTARVFDPRVFRIIETITPRMVASEPTGSFYPVEEGDVITAQILNSLIKYDWRRADMFPKLVMFVKSMLIFGTAFGRTYWDFREKEKSRMVAKEVNGRMMWTPTNKEKIKVTEFDGPNFEPLNIYDCFPDPNATSKDDMRWFIFRTFRTLKELKAMNDLRGESYYKNLDKLEGFVKDQADKDYRPNAGSEPSYMQYREHRRTMLSTQELKGKDNSNPDIVVLRRFTRDGWCDIVPEYNLVIREVENPYFDGEIPIIIGVDYPYPGELYGMGEIEPIDRIQRAINAVLNQRLDNVQLVLRNMWKVRRGANVDLGALVSAPGNVIQMDDLTALEAIIVPDVTGSTFVQTMDYLTSAMQNGSGITDYTQGTGDSNVGNKTATGIRLVQQEANAQFKLKIQLFNHMVITPVANKWKDLRIQYTTEAQKLRIIGKDTIEDMVKNTDLARTGMNGEEIMPGDETPSKLQVSGDGGFAFLNLLPEDIQPSIVGDWDFVASISSEALMDPIAVQENFFVALDRVSTPEWTQGLASQGKQLDYTNLTRKTFEKMNIGIEGDDVLTDVKQPQMGPEGEQMLPGQEGMPLDDIQIDTLMQPQPNMFEEVIQPQEEMQ